MESYSDTKSAKDALDRAIAELAAKQYGVFSREQAVAAGATPAMIRVRVTTGRWSLVVRSVYRIAGAPPSWLQMVFTGWLACRGDALASHLTAARLWAYPRAPQTVPEFVVPRLRTVTHPGVRVHRIAMPVPPEDRTVRFGIPVTGAVRTVFDLAERAAASVLDEDLVERALEDGLRRKLFSPTRLRWQLQRDLPHRRSGTRLMRKLIDARAGRRATDSELELDLLRFLSEHRIEAIPGYDVINDGEFLGRVDFAIVRAKIALEAESYQFHSALTDWARDHTRNNRIMLAGWLPFPVTDLDLRKRRDDLAHELKRLIASRSAAEHDP